MVEGTGKSDDIRDNRVVYKITKIKAENTVKMAKPGRDDTQKAPWNGEKVAREEPLDPGDEKDHQDELQMKVTMSIPHSP